MRGKNIEKIWYKDDYTNGNKLYIVMNKDKHKLKNYTELFNLVSSAKEDCLEYMYIIYTFTKYEIYAKFKHYIKPIHKAKLRRLLYDWNEDLNNKVESVENDKLEYMKNIDKVVFKKGPAYKNKKGKSRVVSKSDMIKIDFIKFMNKHNLKLMENSNVFINASYNQISIDQVTELLDQDDFFSKYKLSFVDKFYSNLNNENSIASSYLRKDMPIYRPRRRYLEFLDCIYDTFSLKRISKNCTLYDEESNLVVHPCYKFDKTFIYYNQNIPYKYFVQVSKMMEPEMFEWIFNQFTKEFKAKENMTIISYPYISNIFQPLVDVYDNVLYKVDNTNSSSFAMTDCLNKDIIYTQNINPLVSYNKNVLFKDKSVLQSIANGESFKTHVKYKEPKVCSHKIVISMMEDEIMYIPSWISDKILGIQLAKDSVKLEPDDLFDDTEHIGGFVIANMMTNKDEIKKFIKDMRYDNDWNKTIRINGRVWPNYDVDDDIKKPSSSYKFIFDNYEKCKSDNRILYE